MTIQSVTFGGEQYQLETLGNLAAPELAKLFNKVASQTGVPAVKRFSDKATALKRTWAALQTVAGPSEGHAALIKDAPSEQAKVTTDGAGPVPAEVPAPAPKKEAAPKKPAKEKKAKEPKAPRASRGKYFHFKARKVDEQKPIKEGTMRGKLFQLMSREYGATFDQLFNATWGNAEMRSVAGCDDMEEDIQVKTTYEATRLIHYFNGFGLYHDEKDHVHVWSTMDEYNELVKNHPPKHGNGK